MCAPREVCGRNSATSWARLAGCRQVGGEPTITRGCTRQRRNTRRSTTCTEPRRRLRPSRSLRSVETVFDAHVDPALIDRSLAGSSFGSVWLDIPRPEFPPPSGPVTCDLLVIGGGYAGLWSALHAARRHPDLRIVLVEADRIGWAASGRNGGFVDSSLTHGLENGKSRWPNEIDTLEVMGM